MTPCGVDFGRSNAEEGVSPISVLVSLPKDHVTTAAYSRRSGRALTGEHIITFSAISPEFDL